MRRSRLGFQLALSHYFNNENQRERTESDMRYRNKRGVDKPGRLAPKESGGRCKGKEKERERDVGQRTKARMKVRKGTSTE